MRRRTAVPSCGFRGRRLTSEIAEGHRWHRPMWGFHRSQPGRCSGATQSQVRKRRGFRGVVVSISVPSALSLPRGAQPGRGTRSPWPCPSPAPCGTPCPATSCFPPWTDPQATSIRASWVDGGILHPLPFRNSEICEDIIRKYRTRPFVLHDDPHVFVSVQAPSSGHALGTVSPRCGQQGPRPASSSGGASPAPRGSS